MSLQALCLAHPASLGRPSLAGTTRSVTVEATRLPVEARPAKVRGTRWAIRRLRTIATTVTVSVGGTIARPGDAVSAIFGRADAALYRAREGGRNRVDIGA